MTSTTVHVENNHMIRTRLAAVFILITGAAVAASGCVVEAAGTTDKVATSATEGNAAPSEPLDRAATSEALDIGPDGLDDQGFMVHCCKGDPCDDGNAPTCDTN
jgi:hypothetical protein